MTWEQQATVLGRQLVAAGWAPATLTRLARFRSVARAQAWGFSAAEARRLAFARWLYGAGRLMG